MADIEGQGFTGEGVQGGLPETLLSRVQKVQGEQIQPAVPENVPAGDVLGRLENAAAADVASLEASRQTYPQAEVPGGGIAERVDVQRGAELAEGEDNREVVIRVVTSLERAVSNIQLVEGEKPEEFKYRLGLALHEAGVAAVDQFPAKPTTSPSEFR